MATSKPSANVFGTFLENIAPGPSKSAADFDQITKQAIEWSTSTNSAPVQSEPPGHSGSFVRNPGSGAISAILKSINGAGMPLSVVLIAKKAGLDVDTVTVALRDAVFAGLIAQVTSPTGGVLFNLTDDGLAMLS